MNPFMRLVEMAKNQPQNRGQKAAGRPLGCGHTSHPDVVCPGCQMAQEVAGLKAKVAALEARLDRLQERLARTVI